MRSDVFNQVDEALSDLAGVGYTVESTYQAASHAVNDVVAHAAQGIRLRKGITEEVRSSLDPRGAKVIILSQSQWVSSVGPLKMFSCARGNDNKVKALKVDVEVCASIEFPSPRPLAPSALGWYCLLRAISTLLRPCFPRAVAARAAR